MRHSQRKRGETDRQNLRSLAPVLDPTVRLAWFPSAPLALIPMCSRLRFGCDDRVGIEQARPGTYVLVLSSRSTDLIQIGRLGALQLQSGFYVYVGSALGPGGVRARLAHHLKLSRRPHWHIDYLRAHTGSKTSGTVSTLGVWSISGRNTSRLPREPRFLLSALGPPIAASMDSPEKNPAGTRRGRWGGSASQVHGIYMCHTLMYDTIMCYEEPF
jgi:Domain of unknown function DUF123